MAPSDWGVGISQQLKKKSKSSACSGLVTYAEWINNVYNIDYLNDNGLQTWRFNNWCPKKKPGQNRSRLTIKTNYLASLMPNMKPLTTNIGKPLYKTVVIQRHLYIPSKRLLKVEETASLLFTRVRSGPNLSWGHPNPKIIATSARLNLMPTIPNLFPS